MAKNHFKIPDNNIRNEKYDPQGGGETYKRNDHYAHGKKLFSQTKEIIEKTSSKKDGNISHELYLQLKSPSDFTIKKGRQNIEELGFKIIEYSKSDKTKATVSILKEDIDDLNNRIQKYTNDPEHIGKTYFSPIEDILEIPTIEKIKSDLNLNSDQEEDIIINLFNTITNKERRAIFSSIQEDLASIANNLQIRNFSNGVTSIACTIKLNSIVNFADNYSTIKEIKKNYLSFVETAQVVQNLPNPLTIQAPRSQSIVCIVDSGIRSNGSILQNLVTDTIQFLPRNSVDCLYEHGTFVASRCIFGDNIDACNGTHELVPFCKVMDLQVFGKDIMGNKLYPNEFLLRTAIEDTVQKFHNTVKVFNLSLGSTQAITSYVISDLAKLLDYLSKEYKVLFIVAAGNIDSLLGTYPNNHFRNRSARLGSPAESLLSITVGSIAKYEDTNAIAKVDEISPFSRTGPGADNGIKPELVAHGGNLIKAYGLSPRIGAFGLSEDCNSLAVNVGTSFAAPLISQYAARLFEVYSSSDPNLVKALLCHFTEQRNTPLGLTTNNLFHTGFGEPIIDNAMQAGINNAAYIYEGELHQEHYQYIKFHIPSTLTAGSENSKLKLKITLVYDPPVNVSNDVEYSQSRISATLIKKTSDGYKKVTISTEDKYSHQWNPIIKLEKDFRRKYLCGDWELKLHLYTRGNLPTNYKQSYAVVIEIIDSLGGTDVYNDILAEYGNIYSAIVLNIAA